MPCSVLLQHVEGLVGEVELCDDVLENEEGGGGVEEGVVPVAVGDDGLEGGGEAEVVAEAAELVGLRLGIDFAGELEGVDPGAEGVAGEGGEEALFGAVGVGDEGSFAEVGLEGWVKL